jgi:hypothetical protein
MNEFFIPVKIVRRGLLKIYLKASKLVPFGRKETCPLAR